MLLRIYRLTDKLGILILKVGAAVADYLLESVSAIFKYSGRGFGGILSLLMLVASFFLAVFGVFGKTLARFGSPASRARRAGNAVVANGADAMARRAARDEIDVIIKEDPLRTQNRRLSFLVLILGVGVLAAVIWATDPSRNQQAIPVAVVPINNDADTQNVATAPTEISSNIAAPTQIPTATPLPEALQARGAIAYTVREQGQTDIWAVNVGSRNPIRITNDEADERDPEWGPDGTRLAYAARIDGNWIYMSMMRYKMQLDV